MGFQKVSNFIKGIYLGSALLSMALGFSLYENRYDLKERINNFIYGSITDKRYDVYSMKIDDEWLTFQRNDGNILEVAKGDKWWVGRMLYVDENNDGMIDKTIWTVSEPMPNDQRTFQETHKHTTTNTEQLRRIQPDYDNYLAKILEAKSKNRF